MVDETGTAAQAEGPEVVVKIPSDDPTVVVEKTGTDGAVKDLAEQYKTLEVEAAESKEKRLAAEERAAAAEQEAARARREAQAAREAATSSNLDTITTALASAQAALDAAKRDKKTARESGDFDAESDADDRLIQARIDIRTYDEAKANLETRKQQPVRREGQATPDEIVEAYTQNRTEPTAKWLREHREYILDGRKNAKLTAAHHDAVAEGIKPDTQAYFDHVEKFIGIKKEDAPVTDGDNVQRPGAEKKAETPAKKPAQRSVAPVNGASGTGGAVNNNEVRLSAREADAATDGTHVWNYDDPSGQKKYRKGDPIGIEEFARRKQKLTQQGAYDRTYETQ